MTRFFWSDEDTAPNGSIDIGPQRPDDPHRATHGDWHHPDSRRLVTGARRIFFRVLDEIAPHVRLDLLRSVVPLYAEWAMHPFQRELWEAKQVAPDFDELVLKTERGPEEYLDVKRRTSSAIFEWADEYQLPPEPTKRLRHWMVHTAFDTVSHGFVLGRDHLARGRLLWNKTKQADWDPAPGFTTHVELDPDKQFTWDLTLKWSVDETWATFRARAIKELSLYKARIEEQRKSVGMERVPRLRASTTADTPDLYRKARWLVRFHVLNENQEVVADDEDVTVRQLRKSCGEFREWIDLPEKVHRAAPKES